MHPVDREAFALVEKETRGIRIAAPNGHARRCGIHRGMRLADARALLPCLITQPADPDADARILKKLADWCRRYTPSVAPDGTDGLWLDITGAAHLCGGEDALLGDLTARLRQIGFTNRLGLAGTLGTAWAVARFATSRQSGSVNVHENEMTDALASLPLEGLRLDEEVLYLLKRFGLKTIGALYAIPRASLKRRFASREACEAVLHRIDQALGHVSEPLVSLRPAPAYHESIACAEPILETQSFYIGLDKLLKLLCRRMEREQKGATVLTFCAYHADGGVSRVSIATRPSRDVDHLAHLFRDRLGTINPGLGVDGLVLSADKAEPLRVHQTVLLKSPGQDGDNSNVNQLIDRLSNRLGSHNVWRTTPLASHIPERAEARTPAIEKAPLKAQAGPVKPLRPFRLFERPEPVQVMAEVPEGPPMRFTWRRVTHRIIRAEGPERIAPQWWHGLQNGQVRQNRTRDYYRVEDDKGQRFWLFREGLYRDTDGAGPQTLPTWHIHGLFA